MFKLANNINLWAAGLRSSKIVQTLADGGAVDQLDPIGAAAITGSDVGAFFLNLLFAIANGISRGFYFLLRFIFNIVDFFQYFVKHLIGLDYWDGDVTMDTLADSDIIFKFLYDPTVQRVFKYMMGAFAVLLILFAIIAIIKSNVQYATETKDADNNPMKVVKTCLRAIFTVVITPILLIMGLLASNAVLAGLVNTLNINNHLTLGGQIFTASAYDANRYRKYAENNTRYWVNHKVRINLNDVAGSTAGNLGYFTIDAGVQPVVPLKHGGDNPFTGFAFRVGDVKDNGKETDNYYLYYVSESDLAVTVASTTIDGKKKEITYAEVIAYYLVDILGARLLPASTFGDGVAMLSVSGMPDKYQLPIKCNLRQKTSDSKINIAAYNTWRYNAVFGTSYEFDKTVDSSPVINENGGNGFISDAGMTIHDALDYTNNSIWGRLHDGGTNGMVALPVEYKVMADVVDFAVSNGAEVAVVNASNPLIDWKYNPGDGLGGYLDSRFVKGVTNNEIQKEFIVSYKNFGNVHYAPNMKGTKETEGAIFIIAFYNSASGKFVPVVHNKTYIGDNGQELTFISDSLDPSYYGLVVARGILDYEFSNSTGYPTEINTSIAQTLSGEEIDLSTPHYFNANAQKYSLTPEAKLTLGVTFSSTMVENGKLKEVLMVDLRKLGANSDAVKSIAASLPTSLSYTTAELDGLEQGSGTATQKYKSVTYNLSDITWRNVTSGDNTTVKIDGTHYLVFKSNKTVKAFLDNQLRGKDGANTLFEQQLYAFVNVDTESNSFNFWFAYASHNRETGLDDWFFGKAANLTTDSTNCQEGFARKNALYGTYHIDGGNTSGSDVYPVARFLNVAADELISGNSANNPSTFINQGSLQYQEIRSNISNVDTGRVFEQAEAYEANEESAALGKLTTHFNAKVLFIYPNIDKDILCSPGSIEINTKPLSSLVGTSIGDNIVASLDGYEFKLNSGRVEGDVEIRYFSLRNKNNQNYMMPYSFTYNHETHGELTYLGQTAITVIVSYNRETHALTLETDDTYLLNVRNEETADKATHALMNGTFPSMVSRAALEFLSASNVTSGTSSVDLYKYRSYMNGQYFYFDFEQTNTKGILKFTPRSKTFLNVETNMYNIYTFYLESSTQSEKGKNLYQLNTDGTIDNNVSALSTSSAFIRGLESVKVTVANEDAGYRYYLVSVYKEDYDGNLFADFNCAIPVADAEKILAEENGAVKLKLYLINNATRIEQNGRGRTALPVYVDNFGYTNPDTTGENKDKAAQEIIDQLGIQRPTIKFTREYIKSTEFFWDVELAFFSKNTWRINVAFFTGYGASRSEVSNFKLLDGRFKLDYNFTNSMTPGLSLNIFYIPMMLNFIVLIFASMLILNVLGKAIWGLIQRIFNLTVYFVILPGVVSTMPIDDGSKFTKWKDKVVPEVLGAYGVMIGLNIFFILCPAIKSVSHLFTQTDMDRLAATGNFMGGISPAFINSICEVLFMLVALTMITSLPKLIADMIGGADVHAMGVSTKDNIFGDKGIVKTVGDTMSGKKAMEAVKKTGGTLKNFIPGSAIAEAGYKKAKEKALARNGGTKSKEELAQEQAKQQARERARQLVEEAKNKREGATGADADAEAGAKASADAVKGVGEGDVKAAGEGEAKASGDINVEMNSGANAAYAAHAAVADSLAGDGDSVSAAKAYADAAAMSAAAAAEYANIATGDLPTVLDGGKEKKHKKSRLEKEQEKLADLEKERDEMAEDQANGNAHLYVQPANRKKAYDQYNEGKDIKDQYHSVDYQSDAVYKAMTDAYKAKHGSYDDMTQREAAYNEWRQERANLSYQDKHGIINPITKKADQKKALAEYDAEQEQRRLVAQGEFRNKKIDDKISKQREKVAQMQAGTYQNWFQRHIGNKISGEMTDKTRDRLEYERDKAQASMNGAQMKLDNAEKLTKHMQDKFVKENGLVIGADGKIDTKQMALKELERQTGKDMSTVKHDKKFNDMLAETEHNIKENLDIKSLESEYKSLGDVEGNKTRWQKDLRSAQYRFDRLQGRLDSGKQGLVHAFASKLKSGGRAVKANALYNMAKFTSWRQDKKESSFYQKYGNHVDKKTLEQSIQDAKDKKNVAALSSERHMDAMNDIADQIVKTFGDGSGTQTLAMVQQKMEESSPEALLEKLQLAEKTYGGKVEVAAKSKKLEHTKAERDRIVELQKQYNKAKNDTKAQAARAQYQAMMQKHQEASDLFDRDMKNVDSADKLIDTLNARIGLQESKSYFRKYNRLQRSRLDNERAAKSVAVEKLNRAQRSGRLTEAQEQAYINEISKHDDAVKAITSGSYIPRFAKAMNAAAAVKKFGGQALGVAKTGISYAGKFVAGAGRVTAGVATFGIAPAVIKHNKRVKAARGVLAGDAGQRNADIAARNTADAARVNAVHANAAAKAQALDEVAQRKYINNIKQALAATGNVAKIKEISDAASAKKVADEVMKNLTTRKNELAGKLATAKDPATIRAQQKVITDQLRKLNASTKNTGFTGNTADVRKEIKAAADSAATATVRNTYKKEFNELMKTSGIKIVAKSGAAAYENSKQLKQMMNAENDRIRKELERIARTSAANQKAHEDKIKKMQEQLRHNDRVLEKLKKLNEDTEKKASKVLKKTTNMDRIMQDMRRQSKYGIKNFTKKS